MDSSINRGSKPTLADEDYEVFGLQNNGDTGKSNEINITIEEAIKGMREKSRFGSTAVGTENYSDSKNIDQEECDGSTFGDRDIVQHANAMPKPVGVAHYVQFDMDHTLCGYEVATAEEIGLGHEISVSDSSLRKDYIDNNESGSEDVSTEEVFDELENRDDLIEEFQSPDKNYTQDCKDENVTKFVHNILISKHVDKLGTPPSLIECKNKSDQVNNKSDIAIFYESIAPSLVDERNEPIVTNRHLYDDKMPVLLPEIEIVTPESNAIPEQVIGVVHPFNHKKRSNEDKQIKDVTGIAVFSNNKKPLKPPTEIITRNRIRSHCLDSVTNVPRSMIKKHHSIVLKRDPITKAIPTVLNGLSDKYSDSHNADYISNDVNIPQGISSGNHFRTVYKEVKQIVSCEDPKEILNENEHSSLETRLLFTIKSHSAKVPEKNKFTASVYDVYDFNDDSCDGKTEEYKNIRSSYMSKGLENNRKKIYDVEEKMKNDKINNHFNKAHDTQTGIVSHNERKKNLRRHSPNKTTSMPILMSPTRDPSPPPFIKNNKGETSKKSINQDVTRKHKTVRSTATPLRSFQRLPINEISQTIANTNKKNIVTRKNFKLDSSSVNKPIMPAKKINVTTVASVVQDISNDLKDFGIDLLERELNFDPCERVTRSSARKKEYLDIKTEPLMKDVLNKKQLNNSVMNVNSPDFVPLEALAIETKENDGSFLTFDNLLTDLSPDQTTNPLDDCIHSPLFMKDIQSSTDILEVLPGPDILDGGVADKEVIISSADVLEIKNGIVEEVQVPSLDDGTFSTIENLFQKNLSSSKTVHSQENECIDSPEHMFEKINQNPIKESPIYLEQVNAGSISPVTNSSFSSISVDNQIYNKESKAVEILRTIVNEVHTLNKETKVQNYDSSGPLANNCDSKPINNIMSSRKDSLNSEVPSKQENPNKSSITELNKKEGANEVATNSRMSDSNFNSANRLKYKTQRYQKKLRLGKKRSNFSRKRKSGYNLNTIKKLESSDQLSNISSKITTNLLENKVSSTSVPIADSNSLCRRHLELKNIEIGEVLKRLDENVKICTNATSNVVKTTVSQNLKVSLEENSSVIEKDFTENHSIVEDLTEVIEVNYARSNKMPLNEKSDSASNKINSSDTYNALLTVNATQPAESSAVKIPESDSKQKKLSNIQVLIEVNNLDNCKQQSLLDQKTYFLDVNSQTNKVSELKLTSECAQGVKISEKTDFIHDPSKGSLVTVDHLNKPASNTKVSKLKHTKVPKFKSKKSELVHDGVLGTSEKITDPRPNSEVGEPVTSKQIMSNAEADLENKGGLVPNKQSTSSDGTTFIDPTLKIQNVSSKPDELSANSVQTIECKSVSALKNKDILCKIMKSTKSPLQKKRLEPNERKAGLEYIIKKLTLKSEKHTNDDEHVSKICQENNKVTGSAFVNSVGKIEIDADLCKSTSDSVLQESTDNSSDLVSGCHLETEIIHDNLDAQLELIYVKNDNSLDMKENLADNKFDDESLITSKFNNQPSSFSDSVSSEIISDDCIEQRNEISLDSSKINVNVSEICKKEVVVRNQNESNVPQLDSSKLTEFIEGELGKCDQKIKINDEIVKFNLLKEGFKTEPDKVTTNSAAIFETEKNQKKDLLETLEAPESTSEESLKNDEPKPGISENLDDVMVCGKESQNETDGNTIVIKKSATEHQIKNAIVEKVPEISSKSVKINPSNYVRPIIAEEKLNSNDDALNSIKIKEGLNEKTPELCDIDVGSGTDKEYLHKPINGLNSNFSYSNITANLKEKYNKCSSEFINIQENQSENLVEQNYYENEINLKSEIISLLKSSIEFVDREPLAASQDKNVDNLKQLNDVGGLVKEKKLVCKGAIAHDKPIENSVISDQETRTENLLEKTRLKLKVLNCESKTDFDNVTGDICEHKELLSNFKATKSIELAEVVLNDNEGNSVDIEPRESDIKKVDKLTESEMVISNCEGPESSIVCCQITEKILENTNSGADNKKTEIGDDDKKLTADVTGSDSRNQIEEDKHTKECSTLYQEEQLRQEEYEPINRSTDDIDKEKLNMALSGGSIKDYLLSRLESKEIITELNSFTIAEANVNFIAPNTSANCEGLDDKTISDSNTAKESTINNNLSVTSNKTVLQNAGANVVNQLGRPNMIESDLVSECQNTMQTSEFDHHDLSTDLSNEKKFKEHELTVTTIINQISDSKVVTNSTPKEMNDLPIDNSEPPKEQNDPTIDNSETSKERSDSIIGNDQGCALIEKNDSTTDHTLSDTLQKKVPKNIDSFVVNQLEKSDSMKESKLISESVNIIQASKAELLDEEHVLTDTTTINQASDRKIVNVTTIQSSNDYIIDNIESSKELNDSTINKSETSKEPSDSTIDNSESLKKPNDYIIDNIESSKELNDSTINKSETSKEPSDSTIDNSESLKKPNDYIIDNIESSKELNDSTINKSETSKEPSDSTIDNSESLKKPNDYIIDNIESSKELNDSTINKSETSKEHSDSTIGNSDSSKKPNDYIIDNIESSKELNDSTINKSETSKEHSDSTIDSSDSSKKPIESTVDSGDIPKEQSNSTISNDQNCTSKEKNDSTIDNNISDTLEKKVPNNSETVVAQLGKSDSVRESKLMSESLNIIQASKAELLDEEHLLTDTKIIKKVSGTNIAHFSTIAINPSDISKEMNHLTINNSESTKEQNDPIIDNSETSKESIDSTIDSSDTSKKTNYSTVDNCDIPKEPSDSTLGNGDISKEQNDSTIGNNLSFTSKEKNDSTIDNNLSYTLEKKVPSKCETVVVTQLGKSDSVRESKLISESLNIIQASKAELLDEEHLLTDTKIIKKISGTNIAHFSNIDNIESSKELNDSTINKSETSKEPSDSTIDNSESLKKPNDYIIDNIESSKELNDSTINKSETSKEPSDSTIDNSDSSKKPNDSAIGDIYVELNDTSIDNSVKSKELINSSDISRELNDSTIDDSAISKELIDSTVGNSDTSMDQNDSTICNNPSNMSKEPNDSPIDNSVISKELLDTTVDNPDTSTEQNDSTDDNNPGDISKDQNYSTFGHRNISMELNFPKIHNSNTSKEHNYCNISNNPSAISEERNDCNIDNCDLSKGQIVSNIIANDTLLEKADSTVYNCTTIHEQNGSTIINNDTLLEKADSTFDNSGTSHEQNDSDIDNNESDSSKELNNSTSDSNLPDTSKKQVSEKSYVDVTCSEKYDIRKSEIVSKKLNIVRNGEINQYDVYSNSPNEEKFDKYILTKTATTNQISGAKTNNYSTISTGCSEVTPLGLDQGRNDLSRVTSSHSKNICSENYDQPSDVLENSSTRSEKITLMSQNETQPDKLKSDSFSSLIFNCVQCHSISGSSINNDIMIIPHSRQLSDPNTTTIIHHGGNSCREVKVPQQISDNTTDTDLSQNGSSNSSVETLREGDIKQKICEICPLEEHTDNVSHESYYDSPFRNVMSETKSKLSGINEIPNSEKPKSHRGMNKPKSFSQEYDIFLEKDSKNDLEDSVRKIKCTSATESNISTDIVHKSVNIPSAFNTEQDEILQRLIKEYKDKSKEDVIVDTNITSEENSNNKANMTNNIKPIASLTSDELIKKYKLKDLRIKLKKINMVSQPFDVMPTVESIVNSNKNIRQLLGQNDSIKRTSTSNDIKEPPRKIFHVESTFEDPHLALDENKKMKIVKETSHGNSGTSEEIAYEEETTRKKEVNLKLCCPMLQRLSRFADLYKCMDEHKVNRVSIPIIIYNSFKKTDGQLLALRPDLEIICTKPVERKMRYKRRRRKVSSSETDEFEYDDSSAVSLAGRTKRRTSKRTRESKRSKINQRNIRVIPTDGQVINSQTTQEEQSSRVLGLASVNDTSSSRTTHLTCKRPIKKEFMSETHPKPTNLKDLNSHSSSSSKEPETVMLPTAKENLLSHKSSFKIAVPPDGSSRLEESTTLPEMVSTCSSRGLTEVLTADNMRQLLHTVAKNRRLNQRVETSEDEEDSDDDFFGFKDCHCPAYTRCENICYISRWKIKHDYLNRTIVLLSSRNANPRNFRASSGEEHDVCRPNVELHQQTSCNFRSSSEESSGKKRGIRRKNEEQLCQQTNAKRFRDPEHNKICFVSLGSRSGSVVKTVKQKRFLSSQDSQSQLVVAVKNIEERRPSPQVARRAETSNSEEDASSEGESSESSS